MKFHGLDWQSNPKVTIQQSTKMDFQSKSNPKKDWIFGFFQIHNPILPTSAYRWLLYIRFLLYNIPVSDELVSLCFGKEIMAEQSASAAEKSELTLEVSHSTTTTTLSTLTQELLSFITGRRKNSWKFATGVLILYLCYAKGLLEMWKV